MALAVYDSSLAYDQIMQRGLPGRPVEVTDAETGIPVEGLEALDGTPIDRLVSNSQGYVQPFQVQDGPPLIRVRIGSIAYVLLDMSLLGEASRAAQQAAQAAVDAANLVGAPADTAIATAVNAAGSATRAAMDARYTTAAQNDAKYASKATATSAADGLMAKADKATLDTATGSNTGSALVRRYSDGTFTTQQISLVGTPTAISHAARKDYVDGLDAVPKLPYKGRTATDAASTYPTGYSTGLFAAADGWPHPSFSQVVTFSPPGYTGGTVQWAYPYTDSSLPPKWRSATNATGNPWGPWRDVADTASVKDEAGRVANQSITTEYRPANGAAPEHYLTVFRNGDKTPGSVRRIVGGNSNSTKPPQETPESYYAKTGATVLINASGWWSGLENKLMGLSIKDGVLIQGWEASGDLGNESCVIMRDGELRIYEKDTTPDPATIIADGGFNSFSWGAAVYKNGSVTNFRTKYTRYSILSARQCVGSTTDGHIFIMTFPGVTGSSGATGDGLVAAAQASGLNIKHMYVLDGGGSAQTWVNGEAVVQSSDGASRPVPDALYFYGPLSSSKPRGATFRALRATGTQSIPNASYTTVTALGPGPGDNPDCAISVSAGVATVRAAGVYSIEGQVFYPSNATGIRYAAILVNGSTRYRAMQAAADAAMSVPVSATIWLDAGTTVAIQAYQSSGGALTLPADADGNRWSIRKVG